MGFAFGLVVLLNGNGRLLGWKRYPVNVKMIGLDEI